MQIFQHSQGMPARLKVLAMVPPRKLCPWWVMQEPGLIAHQWLPLMRPSDQMRLSLPMLSDLSLLLLILGE